MAVKTLRMHGKGGYEKTRGAIHRAIMSGEDFNAGNMHGRKVTAGHDGNRRYTTDGSLYNYGQLPNDEVEKMLGDDPDYVVYSFTTPIAWHVPESEGFSKEVDPLLGHCRWEDRPSFWRMPDCRYSNTTSRHQGIVRVALSLAEVKE